MGLQASVPLGAVGTNRLLLKWPLGLFIPEKWFLVAVINGARRVLPASSSGTAWQTGSGGQPWARGAVTFPVAQVEALGRAGLSG